MGPVEATELSEKPPLVRGGVLGSPFWPLSLACGVAASRDPVQSGAGPVAGHAGGGERPASLSPPGHLGHRVPFALCRWLLSRTLT